MKRVLLAVAMVALLVGCTAPVQLRYPDGRIVQCGPFAGDGSHAAREAKCIDDHRAQGAVRL
jgi:hypothetical protein